MRTPVPEKILKIIEDIGTSSNAPLTRLTVLKKWFEPPGRLPAFGLWIAHRAVDHKGKPKGATGRLLAEASALLGSGSKRESLFQKVNPVAVRKLQRQARDFQQEFQNQQWGPVRIIQSWPLLLVEKGLALYAGLDREPTAGYKLAADWIQNYDSRHGNGLNGPSRGKLAELMRFMYCVEALEDEP